MERKKMLHTLQEARGCLGSYDEFPTLPAGTDPMPYLSRNRVPQPFYLVSETDRVVLALAGRSTLLLPGATRRRPNSPWARRCTCRPGSPAAWFRMARRSS